MCHFKGIIGTFSRRFATKSLSQIDSEGSKGVFIEFSANSTEPFERNMHFCTLLQLFTRIWAPLKPGAYRFTCNVVAALQPRAVGKLSIGMEEALAFISFPIRIPESCCFATVDRGAKRASALPSPPCRCATGASTTTGTATAPSAATPSRPGRRSAT